MQQLNKQIEYKGYKFNISVSKSDERDVKIPNKHFTIITNDMGFTNFYRKSVVLEKDVEYYIALHSQQAVAFVNEREKVKEPEALEITLRKLGFE